jgi:serine/threonine-protein kinase RsbW
MERSFERDLEAVAALASFVDGFLHEAGLDGLSFEVNLIAEELFTNQVKYNPSGEGPVRIALRVVDAGVELRLTDRGGPGFDPTSAPEVDVRRRPEERRPGGLGLHLVRRLADRMQYHHDEATGTSTVIVTKRQEAGDDPDREA